MEPELSTTYLGLQLKSPVIVGSCPLTIEPEAVRQMVECGVGAIVLPSILQEQIERIELAKTEPLSAMDQTGYQPQHDKYNGGPENYLHRVHELTSQTKVPIIANMNGATNGDWLDFAKRIEASGADAIELNVPPVVDDPSRSSEQIESELCGIVQRVCDSVSIPVAVKLTQRFTNLSRITHDLHSAGAAGVVLFAHQPRWDVCLDRLHWTIRWALTSIDSVAATLEGIVRARAGDLNLSIAASGGIRNSEDAMKAMIAGADAVMVTSEIYREGPDVIRTIVDGMSRYIELSAYDSIENLRRSRPPADLGSDRLKRLEYLDPLTRSETYADPTPVSAPVSGPVSGDRFGHRT
jgi:dihydroorotate dehydrogenase (fumarate)